MQRPLWLTLLVCPVELSDRAGVLDRRDVLRGLLRHALGDTGAARAGGSGPDAESVYRARYGTRFIVYTPPARSATLVFLASELRELRDAAAAALCNRRGD